ncbi:MAG: response regulator [Spirochaetes bacterium]|nr:response regulator [Spirochaetota bacterium]
MEKKANILVVDDEESVRITLSEILRLEGYSVATASSGLNAIDIIKVESFDAVILDIKMPKLNGVETFREIKKISPETIVVMMTAHAVDELIAEAIKEGACGIIYKPLDFDQIFAIFEKNLNKTFILLVDDEEGIRETLSHFLKDMGYRVVKATSGKEAIAILDRKVPDVLILDVKMEDIDGVETLKKINKVIPGSQKMVTIMISGYDVNDKIKEAEKLGAKAFFPKPIDIKKLKASIDKLLKKKKKGEREV